MALRPPPTPRHARRQRHRSGFARGAVLALVGVLAFTGTGVALAYRDIQGNINQHDIDDFLGERPTTSATTPPPIDPSPGDAINILLLGSDSREGEVNARFGEIPEEGQRSDTTMLVHISADRERVEVVSIPRDTLVEIPSCRLPDGTTTEPRAEAMFNTAFTTGASTGDVGAGAACTIRTVENMTGIYVDDFAAVDFAGFMNVIDALGGVPMCIPVPMYDERAELDLEPGYQVLDGHDALAFARARYEVKEVGGDGSDISRIGRQQELVAAIVRTALSKNLLTDLPELYRFLDAATQTVQTGNQIGRIPTLAGLAYSLRTVDPENVVFVTMPFEWAGYRVRPAAEAEELWAAIDADEPIVGTLNALGEEPTAEPTDAATDGTTAPTDDPTTAEPTAPPTGAPTETATPVCA